MKSAMRAAISAGRSACSQWPVPGTVSMLPFGWNVYITLTRGERVTVDDPWGWGRSLEWATSCPPPRHNFTSLPRIRSESPAFDLHHPEITSGD